MIEKVVFDSGIAGPDLLIFSSVHGDEQEPVKAVGKIIGELQSGAITLKSGKVSFVQHANKPAYDKNKRYIDEDLNRIFYHHPTPDTSEKKIANELIREIDTCDYFLDLHTISTSNPASVFLDYETPENTKLALAMGIPVLYIGWPEMYAGTGENLPSSTDYAHAVGKHSVLVECGGHRDANSAVVAEDCIRRALGHLGLTDYPAPLVDNAVAYKFEEIHRNVDGAELLGTWNNLDIAKAGTELIRYHKTGGSLTATYDRVVLLPNGNALEGDEMIYLGSKVDGYKPAP